MIDFKNKLSVTVTESFPALEEAKELKRKMTCFLRVLTQDDTASIPMLLTGSSMFPEVLNSKGLTPAKDIDVFMPMDTRFNLEVVSAVTGRKWQDITNEGAYAEEEPAGHITDMIVFETIDKGPRLNLIMSQALKLRSYKGLMNPSVWSDALFNTFDMSVSQVGIILGDGNPNGLDGDVAICTPDFKATLRSKVITCNPNKSYSFKKVLKRCKTYNWKFIATEYKCDFNILRMGSNYTGNFGDV